MGKFMVQAVRGLTKSRQILKLHCSRLRRSIKPAIQHKIALVDCAEVANKSWCFALSLVLLGLTTGRNCLYSSNIRMTSALADENLSHRVSSYPQIDRFIRNNVRLIPE